MYIAAAIDGPATFGQAGAIEITAAPGTGARPLAQATLDAATTERTLLLAELYQRGPAWRIRAVGQGYDHDLATLARSFGVDVTDGLRHPPRPSAVAVIAVHHASTASRCRPSTSRRWSRSPHRTLLA
ncbi:MAG: TerD family protein, partial [Thermocrispum sp.]